MRMRELEQRTGVGRETIRFYIREGLLPEPERASRNSAGYSEDHVVRVKAIKRLQEERFLPLSVIKALLNANETGGVDYTAFPNLDTLLLTRLDAQAADSRRTLAELSEQTGQSEHEIREMDRIGLISIAPDGTVDGRDAAIAARWSELRSVGFTRERGFMPDESRLYVEFVEWLAAEEVRVFFGHMVGQALEEEAATAAERGIGIINDVLGMMRTRALLRRLHAVQHTDQDRATRKGPAQSHGDGEETINESDGPIFLKT